MESKTVVTSNKKFQFVVGQHPASIGGVEGPPLEVFLSMIDRTMDLSNNHTHAAKRPNSSTGSMPNDPICLLDDSDDDEATDSEGCVVSLVTSKAQDLDRKPAPKKERCPTGTCAESFSVENKTIDGCMKNPKHPIKLFATDRDKATRRRLRRQLAKEEHSTIQQEKYRNHWSNFHCWTFREMLGFDRFSGLRHEAHPNPSSKTTVKDAIGIEWMFISTYIMDVDFLMNELPELVNIPIVVIVYQFMHESLSGKQERWVQQASALGHSLTFLVRNPRDPPKSATNPLKHTMEYGCQHTKMTLVGYSSGRLRVHIHTSNLGQGDVHDKCQAAFLQDFVPKTEDQIFDTSIFEESLVTYMESYDYCEALPWKMNGEKETLVSHLQSYDYSKAVGVLVPSIPGYHSPSIYGSRKDKVLGYRKVHLAIRDHCSSPKSNDNPNPLGSSSSIVCQCSSMGSLSKNYLNKIADAWNVDKVNVGSLSPKKKRPKVDKDSFSLLKIVWPTFQEILSSVEGFQGGGSVPGRAKNLHKDFLRPLLHRWASPASGNSNAEEENDLQFDKARHVPHIKSYYQMCPPGNESANDMYWFVLSSHNLSKAAWGEIQNRQDYSVRGNTTTSEVLVIQHWELGVFVSPSTLGVDAMGAPSSNQQIDGTNNSTSSTRTIIPLPYQFQPIQYTSVDRPWVVEEEGREMQQGECCLM